uniref:Uncharacterized protein n=1 Tax=Solanum lycopersicum TaxID=4081 RepID=A0A3Q7H6Z3_SOLLC
MQGTTRVLTKEHAEKEEWCFLSIHCHLRFQVVSTYHIDKSLTNTMFVFSECCRSSENKRGI